MDENSFERALAALSGQLPKAPAALVEAMLKEAARCRDECADNGSTAASDDDD